MATPDFADTDCLADMLEAWGATNVGGDCLSGELRWTSPNAHARCYVTPRKCVDGSLDYIGSAVDLSNDGPFVSAANHRTTRAEAIADAEAIACSFAPVVKPTPEEALARDLDAVFGAT